jgi:hypothetical protein
MSDKKKRRPLKAAADLLPGSISKKNKRNGPKPQGPLSNAQTAFSTVPSQDARGQRLSLSWAAYPYDHPDMAFNAEVAKRLRENAEARAEMRAEWIARLSR